MRSGRRGKRHLLSRLGLLGLLGLMFGCRAGAEKSSEFAVLEIEPHSVELARRQQLTLEARAWDAEGMQLEARGIRWSSSDPEVVSVDSEGRLLALREGEAEILAAVGSTNARVAVKVREAELASLTIEPSSIQLVEGESIQFEAVIRDEIGEVYAGLPVEWTSSAPLFVEVDETGLATGLWKDRTATVTARHGALEDSVEVEVLAPLYRLILEPGEIILLEGESAPIDATYLDANLGAMEPRSTVWTSEDEEIARVDEAGIVEAVGPGQARIYGASEGITSWVQVRVEPRATHIELDLDPLEIRVGGRVPLRARGLDARGDEVPGLEIAWSVGDEEIAFLLGKEAVEGIATGATTITATNAEHGVEASAALHVRDAASFRLLGPTAQVLPAGDRFELRLEVEDEKGEIVPARDPVWFTSDASVATIDQEGRVEIVGVGRLAVGVRVEGHTIGYSGTAAVRFSEMALGEHSTCGLVPNGTVWCWGRKASAGFWGASYFASWIPEMVAEGIVAIRHGKGSCEELPSAGEAICDVTYGLQDDGSIIAFHLGFPPQPIEAPPFVDFDAAAGELCGITSEGAVHCLGQSLDAPWPVDSILMHPLGHCLLVSASLHCQGQGPFQVDLSAWSFARPPGAPFPFSASSTHGCALSSNGEAICWGGNEMGQIEEPPDEEVWLEPRVVATGIEALAVADGVTFLKVKGGGLELRGMGRILFNDPMTSACLDDDIPSFSRQEEVDSFYVGEDNHRCLLLENGRPYCWGRNDSSKAGYRPMINACGDYYNPVLHPTSPYPHESFLRVILCEPVRCPAGVACVLDTVGGYVPTCEPGSYPPLMGADP